MNLPGTLILPLTLTIAVIALIMIISMKRTNTPQKNHPGVILGLITCSGVLLTSILFLTLMNHLFCIGSFFHFGWKPAD